MFDAYIEMPLTVKFNYLVHHTTVHACKRPPPPDYYIPSPPMNAKIWYFAHCDQSHAKQLRHT